MIKEIKIKGFQAHKNFKLKLKRITTITGESDVGKTSIIRALKWVVLNRPSGDKFMRDTSKETFVQLKIGKNIIERRKGRENLYKLNEKVFTAFGNDVPAQIKNITKMTSFNFQDPHGYPFWFFDSAGEVSKQLNKIVNLEIMDTSLNNVAQLLRKKKKEKDLIEAEFNQNKVLVKEMKYIIKKDKEYSVIEKMEEKLSSMEERFTQLKEIVLQSIKYKKIERETKEMLKPLKYIYGAKNEVNQMEDEYLLLNELLQKSIHYNKMKNKVIPDTSKTDQQVKELKDLEKKFLILSSLLNKINGLDFKEDEIKKCKEKINRIKVCPLCNQKIVKRLY